MDIAKAATPVLRRPRTWWLAGIAAGLALVLAVSLALGRAAPTVKRSDVWIGTAEQGEMKREIRANGTLVPRQVRWITAGAPATVQQVVVEPGARVTADTLILQLVNPELQANFAKQKAALAGAEAAVAAQKALLHSQLLDAQSMQTQAESDLLTADIKRVANERAFEKGASAEIEVKQSKITVEQDRKRLAIQEQRVTAIKANIEAQVRSEEAKRDEAMSALAIARQQLDALGVRAGIDGILQQVDVEPGQQIPSGGKLARVARPDDLIARLQVPEALANEVALDLPVDVDTRNGHVTGRLIRVDPSVRNGSVTVDVAFEKPLPAGARPDLSVEGRVVLGTLANVVNVGRPYGAGADQAGSLFVIHPGDNEAHRVSVRYGAMSSDRAAVLEGLHAGDQAILSDTSQWNGYDTLRLR
ncbi:efflux RND transporter periplasmic adaptor subunit [Luteibacter aegosomatissinici]|uniref:efflux RND transporter periplasmic adaptor subunit n=1 Tax=Luteibacter aegosomatissinici TaxID=2911539 RepID=UPI001FF9FC51|nr:HlyD family efflux transporter periplasmic adaptor subunit [Luteibacter aegosomatissinici]UPG92628.1 HlyD family efflux transporter periplasmic adaptor subunit [Luteibacter aegosomatissinici]